MKISTKGRYALRLMLDLALHDQGRPVRLKDVAARQEISVKYLESIASILAKAGYVRSRRHSETDRREYGSGGLPGDRGKSLSTVRIVYHTQAVEGA